MFQAACSSICSAPLLTRRRQLWGSLSASSSVRADEAVASGSRQAGRQAGLTRSRHGQHIQIRSRAQRDHEDTRAVHAGVGGHVWVRVLESWAQTAAGPELTGGATPRPQPASSCRSAASSGPTRRRSWNRCTPTRDGSRGSWRRNEPAGPSLGATSNPSRRRAPARTAPPRRGQRLLGEEENRRPRGQRKGAAMSRNQNCSSSSPSQRSAGCTYRHTHVGYSVQEMCLWEKEKRSSGLLYGILPLCTPYAVHTPYVGCFFAV